MGSSGCCNGDKCEQCPEGQSGDCNSDADCQTSKTENFKNQKISDLNNIQNGYFSASGQYIRNSFSSCHSDNKQSLCAKPAKKITKKHDLSNWIHQENKVIDKKKITKGPVYIYDQVVKKYGKPDVIANQPRGICIWYIEQKNGDIHHSIELKDEYVSHCVPAKHHDFLYSYIKVYVPPEKIKQVLSVSGSVGYDGLQKLLYARCASFEANMATLASAFLVLNNKDPNYVYQIKKRFASFENNLKYVEKQIKINQNKYKKELDSAYYDLAFPEGCK